MARPLTTGLLFQKINPILVCLCAYWIVHLKISLIINNEWNTFVAKLSKTTNMIRSLYMIICIIFSINKCTFFVYFELFIQTNFIVF